MEIRLHSLLLALTIFAVWAFLSFLIVVCIFGASFMFSMWYTESVVIDDREYLEFMKTNFSNEEIFVNLIQELEDYSITLSEGYTYGLIGTLIALTISSFLIVIAVKLKNHYEFFSGQIMRLHLTSTSITIIFSIMFAISLIFISTISFSMVSKNQLISLTLTLLVDANNSFQIIEIFKQTLLSYEVSILTNSISASYFGFTGIIFLIAKIIQLINHERPNVISETFILSGLISVIFWVFFFFIFTGIEQPPSIPNPEISLNFTGT